MTIEIYGIGAFNSWVVSDSFSDTYTEQVSSVTGSGAGSSTYIFTTVLSKSGGDTITVATGGGARDYTFFGAEYSGVIGIGTFGTYQNDNAGFTGTASVLLNNVGLQSWIVGDVLITTGASGYSVTQGNGQILRSNPPGCTSSFTTQEFCQQSDVLAPSTSFTLSTSWSGPACTQPCNFISDSQLELLGNQISPLQTVTNCAGNCGVPPVKLVNANSTHTINFNITTTIFYEFQSGVNGLVQNVTVNVAKSYTNNQQVGLGIWTANCPAGFIPFTIQCTGALAFSKTSSPNPVKGQFAMAPNLGIIQGEWIAIGVSGLFSGLDLNETNADCGANGNGVCTNPPGLLYTNGFIPTTISASSICSPTNGNPAGSPGNPCSNTSIDFETTGIWAFIQSNTVPSIPPPTASQNCLNTDLSCFMAASICALSPSNCAVGAIVYLFGYFLIITVTVHLSVAWVKRETNIEIHVHPAFYPLVFWAISWMLFGVGVLPLSFIIIESLIVIIMAAGAIRMTSGIHE